MPVKRYSFKHRVELCPRSYGDVLNDDPSESKNVIIPTEPENWKYGIYFTDDYDYSQHLVSMNDFTDESTELNPIDFDKKVSMHPSLITKTATVIKEFEFDKEQNLKEDIIKIADSSKIQDLDKQYDEYAIEEFKSIVKDDLDEELLFSLMNAKDVDELSNDDLLNDNFVELADHLPSTFKGDKEMMERFFGDETHPETNYLYNQSNSDDEFNFEDDILKAVNEISQKHTFVGESKKLKLSVDGSSKSAITCLSALSILARSNEQREARKNMTLVNPVPEDMKKYIIYDDVEYDSEEIDKAVDEWAGITKEDVISIEQLRSKKPAKLHIPQLMSIPKETKSQKRNKKKKNGDQDSMDCDEQGGESVTRMNVSEFHVPRKPNETTAEKKERKRNIKVAKRIGQEQKKELRNAFKAMGQ